MFRRYYTSGFTTEETTSVKNVITHKGYKSGDTAQEIVNYAYNYTSGDMEFLYLLECESGMNPLVVGDSGDAYGLCQMNKKFHKIPQDYYNDRGFQVRYCYDKYTSGTTFYGPTRVSKHTNGQKCKDYVKSRFIINE